MTRLLTQLAAGAGLLASLGLASCQKDEVKATLSPNSAPTLTSSLAAANNTIVLTQANETKDAVTFTWAPISGFTWSNTDKTYTPPVTYTFQVDKQGNNFAQPINIPAGSGPNTTLKVVDLNSALQTLGIAYYQAVPLEVRLQTVYSTSASSRQYTAAVPLTATIYCGQPAKGWSLIGPAGKGWNAGDDIPLTFDCPTNTFVYTGPLKADEFKFRYNNDWVANLGGTSSTGGALTQDGPNLKISVARTYKVVLKPAALDDKGKVSAGSTFTIQ